MKTNTPDQELFKISERAAHVSSAVLEDVAIEISSRPEFPARLSEKAHMAFSRACFQLLLRSGQSNGEKYIGFTQKTMQRIGAFYVQQFCSDPVMRDELLAAMPLEPKPLHDELSTPSELPEEAKEQPVAA